MRQTIRIEDKDAKGVLIGLPRILDVFEPEGGTMTWAMFDLWIIGNLGGGKSVLDLEQESRTVPKGKCVAWRELRAFSEAVTQIIEGTFVGCTKSNTIPDRLTSEALQACDVVISAVDSSFWEVTVHEGHLMKRLQNTFPMAQKISPSTIR